MTSYWLLPANFGWPIIRVLASSFLRNRACRQLCVRTNIGENARDKLSPRCLCFPSNKEEQFWQVHRCVKDTISKCDLDISLLQGKEFFLATYCLHEGFSVEFHCLQVVSGAQYGRRRFDSLLPVTFWGAKYKGHSFETPVGKLFVPRGKRFSIAMMTLLFAFVLPQDGPGQNNFNHTCSADKAEDTKLLLPLCNCCFQVGDQICTAARLKV